MNRLGLMPLSSRLSPAFLQIERFQLDQQVPLRDVLALFDVDGGDAATDAGPDTDLVRLDEPRDLERAGPLLLHEQEQRQSGCHRNEQDHAQLHRPLRGKAAVAAATSATNMTAEAALPVRRAVRSC